MTSTSQNTLKSLQQQQDDLNTAVDIFNRFLNGIFNFVFTKMTNGACSDNYMCFNINITEYIKQFNAANVDNTNYKQMNYMANIRNTNDQYISFVCEFNKHKNDTIYQIGKPEYYHNYYKTYNNDTTKIDYTKLCAIYNNNSIGNDVYKQLPYVKIQLSKDCYFHFACGQPDTPFSNILKNFYNNMTINKYEYPDIENNITCKFKIFKIELHTCYVFMWFLDQPLYELPSKYCFDNHNKVETINYANISDCGEIIDDNLPPTYYQQDICKLFAICKFIVNNKCIVGFICTIITTLFTILFTKYI